MQRWCSLHRARGASAADGPVPPAMATSPSHSGVASDVLEKTGCAGLYEEVELCLAETDRDWSKCQQQLKTFQACFDAYVDEQKRKRADVSNK